MLEGSKVSNVLINEDKDENRHDAKKKKKKVLNIGNTEWKTLISVIDYEKALKNSNMLETFQPHGSFVN